MAIKNQHLVTKRNTLNEIRANDMSLQELRFFSIYLSRINPLDVSTRCVRFKLDEFQNVMDLLRINTIHLKKTTNKLLSKVISVPTGTKGGYESFQLFKYCKVAQDEFDDWFVEIDAHDMALPLMFEFKEKYFTYQLWNALQLKSTNQLRMYEILKQYEKVGKRIIGIEELRELLGIRKENYPVFGDFKKKVLDSCQKALEQYTDIKFTYESTGKKGKGGKILTLEFKIYKNKKYKNLLLLEEFIDMEPIIEEVEPKEQPKGFMDEKLSFYAEACDNEFTISEMQVLYNSIIQVLDIETYKEETNVYDYLKMKYDEMKVRNERALIQNRFAYLKKIIDIEKE